MSQGDEEAGNPGEGEVGPLGTRVTKSYGGNENVRNTERDVFLFFSRETLERLDLGLGFPGGTSGKELPDNPGCLVWFDPWVRRMLW